MPVTAPRLTALCSNNLMYFFYDCVIVNFRVSHVYPMGYLTFGAEKLIKYNNCPLHI